MATSANKGFVIETPGAGSPWDRTYRIQSRYPTETANGASSPLHVDYVIDLANNHQHQYDSSTLVRVMWAAMGISAPGVRPALTFAATDTYYPFMSFGPFPWAIRYDLTFMRPVFRLAAAINDAAYTVTFKVVFTLDTMPVNDTLGLASDEVAVTSTSLAWRTFSATYMDPEPSAAYVQGVSNVATYDPDTEEATSAQWVLCRMDVFAKADNTSAEAYLLGAYLREFIGT